MVPFHDSIKGVLVLARWRQWTRYLVAGLLEESHACDGLFTVCIVTVHCLQHPAQQRGSSETDSTRHTTSNMPSYAEVTLIYARNQSRLTGMPRLAQAVELLPLKQTDPLPGLRCGTMKTRLARGKKLCPERQWRFGLKVNATMLVREPWQR